MSAISCTKCIFAIQDGDDFTCRAGRIDKFLELGKAERADDGSYQLKQFCNLYRPKAWLLTDEKIEEALERAANQSKCSFGIVLEVSNQEDLNESIESIKAIDYPREKIVIVISARHKEVHSEALVLAVEDLQKEGFVCISVTYLVSDTMSNDKDSFSEVMYRKCSMILRIKGGDEIDSNFFSWIDNSVNSELSLTSVFEHEENSVVVIPFGVVNSCYLDFLDYDAMVKELRETSRNQGSYKKYEKK